MVINSYRNSFFAFVSFFFLIGFTVQVYAQEEEDPARIWNVEIEGNERFEDLVIKRYIANERPALLKRIFARRSAGMDVNMFEIRKDVIRIERFYQRRGYPEVEVRFELTDDGSPDRKELTFVISEGAPLIISSVDIEINADEQTKNFILENSDYQRTVNRVPFREGRRFQQIEESEVVGTFTRTLKNIGFVYANTSVAIQVDSLANEAKITIKSTPGPRTRITSVTIEGNESLDDEIIFRETGLKMGAYYSETDIRDAQREVFKHHLFRLALMSVPDQTKDSTLALNLRVKELSLRSWRNRFGIGDFDRLDEKLRVGNSWKLLRAQTTWVHRNVGGMGTQFSTMAKVSFYEKEFNAEYLIPYVFNTKSSLNISPFIENRIEPSYSITTGGLINTLGYEYNRSLTGTFSYEFALNNEYDITNDGEADVSEVLPDSVLNYNISSFSFNMYYARGLSRGRRGLIIQPYLEFSGLFGESTFSFQKAALDVRKYTELNNKLVLATRVQAGAIYYSKQDSLPADIEFYAGGTASVRGFSRRELGPKRAIVSEPSAGSRQQSVTFVPVGGKAMLTFNVELRQQLDRLLKGFGVATFLDGGQVWSGLQSLNSRDIQYSTGGGIRYQTPIGPIRVDLAYVLNPTDQDLNILDGIQEIAGRRWRIHFSIGQAF